MSKSQCLVNSMMLPSFEDNAGISYSNTELLKTFFNICTFVAGFQPWFHSETFWYF